MNNSDIRQISVVACVLLVVIRLSIGWQLLYEGLWKLSTQGTAKPWTAKPYLKNAQGPFRNYFRDLAGDPDDKEILNYAAVEKDWLDWATRFKAHYQLDEKQVKELDVIISGPKEFARGLAELPKGVEFKENLAKAIRYDAKAKKLIVDGKHHFTPREKRDVLKMVKFNEAKDLLKNVKDPVVKKFIEEVQKIYIQQSRLSYLEQANAILQGDPKTAGKINEDQKGTIDGKAFGQIEFYHGRLERYEENLLNAKTQFDQEISQVRLERYPDTSFRTCQIDQKLESDMKWKAEKLLTTDQIARGALPSVMTPARDIDLKTMWTLTIVGALLIAGLFTRIAALAGAFLITQFYLAYPPFPGYPAPPGPEHSMIVNKNLIEILVLLGLVFLPSGRWFGVDAIFPDWFSSKKVPNDRV